LISQALGQLTTTIVARGKPGFTGYIRTLALDPSGEWIAASGETTIALGRINSKDPPTRIELPHGTMVRGMAVSAQGRELMLFTQREFGYVKVSGGFRRVSVGGEFRRVRVSDRAEIGRIDLPKDATPVFSSDGAWIAVPGET